MAVPALNIGGWHDAFLSGTLKNYQGMVAKGATDIARRGQKLLIGPWHHGAGMDVSGEFYFGLMANDAAIDLHGLHLRWYDYWLKGIDNGIMDEAPVRIFVMGDNVWRYEQEWPLARAQYVNYYLHSDGKANTLNGDGGPLTGKPGRGASRRVPLRPQVACTHERRRSLLLPGLPRGRPLRPALNRIP